MKFKTRFTTLFLDLKTPVFEGHSRNLTPRQIVDEYRDLKRGGTYVAAEIIGTDGKHRAYVDIEEMAEG